MIRFACPQCGKEFSVADEHAGQKARCKKCGAIITIAAAPAAAAARASNGAGPKAKAPAAAAKRTAVPARSAQRPPAQRAAQPPAKSPAAKPPPAPANDPLGGFNIDLGALGPLDGPALPAMSAAPLSGGMGLGGGGSLGHKYSKKKKSGNLVLWLVFSGTGLAAVGIVAILVATLINLPGSASFPDNPAAYLPANSTITASVRLRNLLDRASAIPQAKPQIDQALSEAISDGVDPRDFEEVFVVSNGKDDFLMVARIAPSLDPLTVKGTVATGESHQGLPIYSSKGKPRRRTGPAAPGAETVYMVLPRPRLLVLTDDQQQLKAAIDQAKEGRGGAIGLPSGHDLAVRIKDFSQLERGAALPPGTASGEVAGLTGTLDWNDKLSLDVQLDMKDAQKAAELDEKIKSSLQMLAMLSKGQPNAPDLASAIKTSVAGAQLRLTAAVLTSQLSSLAGSGPGPSGGIPNGAAPVGMPAGFSGGQMPGGMPPGGQLQPMAPPGTPPVQ